MTRSCYLYCYYNVTGLQLSQMAIFFATCRWPTALQFYTLIIVALEFNIILSSKLFSADKIKLDYIANL